MKPVVVSYVNFLVVKLYFHLTFDSDSELEVLSNIDDLPPNEGIPWVPSEHEDDNAAKKAKKGKVRAQPPASSPPLQQPIAAQSSVASRARKDHSIGSASSRARAPTRSQYVSRFSSAVHLLT